MGEALRTLLPLRREEIQFGYQQKALEGLRPSFSAQVRWCEHPDLPL
jgi:hypothetical protein